MVNQKIRTHEYMGTDINAAFGHQSEFPPTEALARSMCAGIKAANPILVNNWSVRPDYAYLRLVLVQSSELSIYFGPHVANISTGYGWPYNLDDSEQAQMVTSAIVAIARFFRSPQIIFLPDDIEP